MKKRILALIMIMIFAFCALTLGAHAAGSIQFRVEDSSADAAEGDLVSVPITCTANSGYVIGSFAVNWDSSVLTLSDVKFTQLAPNYNSSTEYAAAAGSYTVLVGNTLQQDNITGTGSFVTLVFKVTAQAKAGSYNITLSDFDFVDTDVNDVGASGTGGVVTLDAVSGGSSDSGAGDNGSGGDKTDSGISGSSSGSSSDSGSGEGSAPGENKDGKADNTAVTDSSAETLSADGAKPASNGAEQTKDVSEHGGDLTWLWITLIVVGIAAVCAVVAVIIIKKKKKA